MSVLERARRNPLVRSILKRRYDRYFAHAENTNVFRGVYATFGEAAAAMPATKPKGYDNPAPAQMYQDRLSQIVMSDYPVLYWMSQGMLAGEPKIFDFGGHVGLTHYAYARYLRYAPGLAWKVLDVPAVTAVGAQLAKDRGAKALSFTQDYKDADGATLFLAAGSLQYVDEPGLAAMLGSLKKRPPHILVSKLPVHEKHAFYTVQNIGTAFCPYRIFQRDEFVRSVLALGYRLVDTWRSAESCPIPYHPEHAVPHYSGFYFTSSTLPAE